MLAGALLLTATPTTTYAGDGGPNGRGVAGWIPYWNVSAGNAAFAANIDLFEEISPFWYVAQGGPGDIVASGTPGNLASIVSTARSAGVPVVPAVRDGNGKMVTAGYMADPTSRSQHADALVSLVVSQGFDGIDLDYEGFAFTDGRSNWPTIQPAWVAFVQELSGKLHAQGKLLVVTVPPIWLSNGAVASGSYTVYDWVNIAAHVDRLRVMTYDWSVGQPGPISPRYWVQQTIDYAKSIGLDMHKLQLGIPFYGRSWVTAVDGLCPPNTPLGTGSVTDANIAALLARAVTAPTRDASSGEITFSYQISYSASDVGYNPTPTPPAPGSNGGIGTAAAGAGALRIGTCLVTRTVWYPDETAIADRAALAVAAGAGVAVWALGHDADWSWTALGSQLAPQR